MIIAIVGPTAVGKTKLSVVLAKRYGAEIISCDSMQIFKRMNIGTAKVTKEEMQGVKHYFIDYKEPNANYSVYDYQKDARKVLKSLLEDKKNVVIVGGTGLYLKALLYNYEFIENGDKKDFSLYTNEELEKMVLKIDKDAKIHANNRERLESYLNNHQSKQERHDDELLYDVKFIGLTRPREDLYEAINKRVDEMFLNGLKDEARTLYNDHVNGKAINTAIGYKELYDYFDGKISLDDATSLIKKRSRNYAKRQYTWFKNKMQVKWFNIDEDNFDNTINDVIKYVES